MTYRYSSIDRHNERWFANDNSVATLRRIFLAEGSLRSINDLDIEFSYPISAIAGENGKGKSTILAMAACAFHNRKTGFRLMGKKTSYYTFSDFFVQSAEDTPPEGIRIKYQILCDRWRRRSPGPAWQERRKRLGGKWNNYDNRVRRNVAFLGITRVVPPSERSTHITYRRYFRPGSFEQSTCHQICEIAGRILAKTYSAFELHEYFKYSLPVVECSGHRYSGFNMGAGENAVFEILTVLFKSGRGTLLVIDEIELGLHEKAQRKLINELKQLCRSTHSQIICSTHSPVILDSLPPSGRFFIQKVGNRTVVTPCISPEFATGKLSGRNTAELAIFVEDEVAQSFLAVVLPHAIRERVNVIKIGSSEAVLRQLAAHYLENGNKCIAILDGDKRGEHNASLTKIVNYTEASTDAQKQTASEWASPRLTYLPGTIWPEKWLLELVQQYTNKDYLVNAWRLEDEEQINEVIAEALRSEKHAELGVLAYNIAQDEAQVRTDLIRFVTEQDKDLLVDIIKHINSLLE